MADVTPKYSPAEFARRGDALFSGQIEPRLSSADRGRFVAIDIDTGDFEIDDDDFTATQRLLDRRANAQIWIARAGERTAYRLGSTRSRGGPR